MNNTRNTILLATLLLASLLVSACIGNTRTVSGSGDVVEETRPVSGVSGVELATLGHLTINLGDTESLRIEAEDNLMEYLETKMLGGTLRIGTQERVNLRNTQPVNYYLTVTSLEAITISSVGGILAPDLKAEKFSITIASTGDLKMGDLEAETLTVKISSSGDMTMGVLNASTLEVDISSTGNLDIAGGQVKTQNITINSSGKYTAEDLKSEDADVRLNSIGSASILVQDNLKAILKSTGNLSYRGDPILDATTDSTGNVIRIRE
jgi:hypothetical protein